MSENKEESNPTTKSNDTILELQLGDVINITDPLNEVLNEQTFIIDYIDKSKTYLINTDSLDRIRVPISPEGIIGDGTITRIAILSRSDTPSYARQNGLVPGKWINIHFGGDFPVIITGEITNLENDMIEIRSIDGDVIYLNFDYKGLPENLPIEMIEIREKPTKPLTSEEKIRQLQAQQGEVEEGEVEEGEQVAAPFDLPEIEKEKEYIDPEKMQLTVPLRNIKDQVREFIIRADQVKFGNEELGPIIQYVDVSTKSQRYSIETQVSDLLDELLSTVPNAQRTPRVLNNIHIMIERFKQLREKFSFFDQYGNVDGVLVNESTFKPIVDTYFRNFKLNLYWILPVVKNIKKVYDVEDVEKENNDIDEINLEMDLKNIRELINNYKSNDLPEGQTSYSALYSGLNPFFTPFELVGDDKQNGVICNKNVNDDINTIIDNLGEMYSSVFHNNGIRNRKFVIQKYTTSLSKLNATDLTGAKFVSVRTNIVENDTMSIKSFLTLPEPVIRFSKINLPGTTILDKANLNLHFFNYWQLFKKEKLEEIFIDNFEKEIDYNEHDFANNIKKFVLDLSEDEIKAMKSKDLYKKFVKSIIPKTKVLFNLMKKYIVGKLSIVDVVSYLEPFLIYTDDLTYKQYEDIIEFISNQIRFYNKKYQERKNIFRMLIAKRTNLSTISSNVYSVMTLLDKKLRDEIFDKDYQITNPENVFSNLEILRKLYLRDYTKLYTTAISVQNFPLMFPTEFSNLFEEEKNKIDGRLKKEETNDKCKTITIAKYYTTLDAIRGDNDKTIYFDKKYDKTNYGLLEEHYSKEVLTMSPEELKEYITKDLMRKKRLSETDADYLADTLVNGYKKVLDGQFAILYKGLNENISDEVDYYIRTDNKWELDSELSKEGINTDESTLLCDMQKQCTNIPSEIDDKCESLKADELGIQTKLLKDVIGEFDAKYKFSREQLKEHISKQLIYYQDVIVSLMKIETNNMLKYNNQQYKLGLNTEDDISSKPFCPYQEVLNLILRQQDFVEKQANIIKFVNSYTRQALKGLGPLNEFETENWLYCIKTNVPILPTFKFTLAEAFIVKGQYGYKDTLEIIKSQIGKLSDDGDWWVDKHSGWPICQVDFDIEEGYEDGFRVVTRAVLEEDAGNKIVSALAEKAKIYSTPETKTISNIVNTLSIAMGINIEIQKEFIINCVEYAIRSKVQPEADYKRLLREAQEKGKKLPSYNDYYNTSLLYYTLGMFLIAIQTCIPSVKTRKTHPGCVRSFSGYPFEGTGDLSSLIYLGCVSYDIRESGEPWNVLKGKKREFITEKIKLSIDSFLLSLPEVNQKFEEKTNYLLTSGPEEIPEEHDISNWFQFLPPLVKFNIKHLVNISSEFKRSLNTDLRIGSINQREKILVVGSKIILFSLALIERIQEVVKRNRLLLHTSNNEPYLENACCESKEGETTIGYFISKDQRISEYNGIVTELSNMMDDFTDICKAGLFYSDINTKNKYPSISNEYNEKTIYLGYIYFCKFNSLIPIPENLIPMCTSKPETELINPSDSIERIIQKLKEDGRNYTNQDFLRLLQVIGKHNIINIKMDNLEFSSTTKLLKSIESIDDENDEVAEKSLRDLIKDALDSYDIASQVITTENYPKQVKDLANFLVRNIDDMKREIIEFVKRNSGPDISNSKVKRLEKTIQSLSTWVADNSTRNENIKISDDKLYNIVNFYKNFAENFVNIFPNIILNKVNYDDVYIPSYYGFSQSHVKKLEKDISSYYEKLKIFYDIPTLQNVLTTIQGSAKNIVKLANHTPSFTSTKINNDKTIKPVFDERTSRLLFEYYLLRILVNYIDLSDEDEMIVSEIKKPVEVADIFAVDYLEDEETRIDLSMTDRIETNTRLLTGNKKELRQKTAELLVVFIEILNKEKNEVDISYEEIQDQIFKLKEREKNDVTDRLKSMTDESRNVDTLLKINKLGMYSKGMQKGLTIYDKNFYDEEQMFRDKMNVAERKIRKRNPNANDENIDILLNDYMEQQEVEREIDADAYDMSYMTEDFHNGQTDGFSAPEEEYQDYQDDN